MFDITNICSKSKTDSDESKLKQYIKVNYPVTRIQEFMEKLSDQTCQHK